MNVIDAYLDGSLSGWGGKDMADAEYGAVSQMANFLEFVPLGTPPGAPRYSVNYQVVRKMLGKDLINIAQQIGDCFLPGVPVLMADGTLRSIETIQAGEQVISHTGKARTVLSPTTRTYSGRVFCFNGGDYRSEIRCTADHLFLKPDGRWQPAYSLTTGSEVVLDGQPHKLGAYQPTVYDVMEQQVHCLNVDVDHSFVASGFTVHNCVSWGGRNAAALTGIIDILVRGDREVWKDPFPPYYYGTSRVQIGGGRLGNSDGSLGSWLAAAVMKYGTIYSGESGVPAYSGSVAKSWGRSGPPADMLQVGANFLIRSAVRISSWEQLVEYLVNGYGLTVASNQGFAMQPDASGFHRAQGNWAHQMAVWDVDDEWSDPYTLIMNSWADVHGRLKDFRTGDPLPPGMLRVHRRDVENMIRSGEVFAFCQYDQPKGQDIHERLFKVV